MSMCIDKTRKAKHIISFDNFIIVCRIRIIGKFFDILSINHDILVFHNGIVPKNCCISDKC